MPTASKLLNYQEWLLLPENDDRREECVNGVIETMPPAKFNHVWVIRQLMRQLDRQLDESVLVVDSNFGLVIRQAPVTQRTPDIAVFILSNATIRDGYFHSPPELAVEVLSPSNSPRQIRGKLSDYAHIGVPEVWIVNAAKREVEIHELEGSRYRVNTLPHDAVTSPLHFPSVSVDFSTIWP